MTTLFLATIGGHLDQLDALAGRIPADGPAVWVTHENYQSRAVLGGRDVEFVPYVRERSVPDVAALLPTAHRLWRRAVGHPGGLDRVGHRARLPALPGRPRGAVPLHRERRPRRGARPGPAGSCERVPGIRRYTQYAHWAGPRWHHRGSVFDDYEPAGDRRPPSGVVRVVVTVGTADEFPFDRLIERLVPLLAPDGELAPGHRPPGRGPVADRVHADRPPADRRPSPSCPAEKLAAAVADADLVVSHAGVGSALTALAAGHRPVLADRSAALGEFRDDHQRQIAAELQRRGLALHRNPVGDHGRRPRGAPCRPASAGPASPPTVRAAAMTDR